MPEAATLAGRTQVTLARYASAGYKDSRAPQNLYPIAGLERALRRRLGDAGVLYRALRSAAGRPGDAAAGRPGDAGGGPPGRTESGFGCTGCTESHFRYIPGAGPGELIDGTGGARGPGTTAPKSSVDEKTSRRRQRARR